MWKIINLRTSKLYQASFPPQGNETWNQVQEKKNAKTQTQGG